MRLVAMLLGLGALFAAPLPGTAQACMLCDERFDPHEKTYGHRFDNDGTVWRECTPEGLLAGGHDGCHNNFVEGASCDTHDGCAGLVAIASKFGAAF